MPTFFSVIPEFNLEPGIVYVEPGIDIKFSVDPNLAFTDEGGLPTEGAKEAAVVTHATNVLFGPDNCLVVIDTHLIGCAHSVKSYTEEAGITPNVTQLTPALINHWKRIGDSRILQPHAQFSLDGLMRSTLISKMVTERWPTVWVEHSVHGTYETVLIPPVTMADYRMTCYKGTNPLFDSNDGILDASGKPVGSLEMMMARKVTPRAVFFDGNTFEVCVYLTIKRAAILFKQLGIQIYCIVDATSFLPHIDPKVRQAIIDELIALGVKFVHSSKLRFN